MEIDTTLKIEELIREDLRKSPQNLPITDFALAKADANAKVICRLAAETRRFSPDVECYGWQIRDAWSTEDTITDILFARDQNVRAAYVRVTAEGVRRAVEELEALGYHAGGWEHSHGNLGVFHSGTDDRNFETVGYGVCPHTMYLTEEVKPIVQDGYLYFDKARIGPAGSMPADLKVLHKIARNPIAYSLVVNKRGEHYVERMEIDLKTQKIIRVGQVGLDVKKTNQTFDISAVEDDIRRKLGLRPDLTPRRNTCGDVFIGKFVDAALDVYTQYHHPGLGRLLFGVCSGSPSEIFAYASRGKKGNGNGENGSGAGGSGHGGHGSGSGNNGSSNHTAPIEDLPSRSTLVSRLGELLQVTKGPTGITYDAQDVHALLLTRFMNRFDIENIDSYARIEGIYRESNQRARDTTRALCRYAMMPFQNGKQPIEVPGKLNHFLSYLNTDSRVDIEPRFGGIGKSLFMYQDRCRVYRQIFTATVIGMVKGEPNPLLESLHSLAGDVDSSGDSLRALYNLGEQEALEAQKGRGAKHHLAGSGSMVGQRSTGQSNLGVDTK